MQSDSLGAVISEYRTSRIQAIVLITLAVVLGGLPAWLFTWDRNIGTPVALVCVPASLYVFGWGYRLAVAVLEIREHGVRLRFPIRRVDIPFSQLASIGKRVGTVNGLPQSANAISFRRVDGSKVIFPLESNVDLACSQIVERMSAGEFPQIPPSI